MLFSRGDPIWMVVWGIHAAQTHCESGPVCGLLGNEVLMFYHIGTCPSENYIKTILYLFIYLFVLFSFALKNTFKYRHRNNIHICLAFVFQCKTNSSSSSTLFTLLSFLCVKPPPLTETDALRHILSFDSVRCEGSLLVWGFCVVRPAVVESSKIQHLS